MKMYSFILAFLICSPAFAQYEEDTYEFRDFVDENKDDPAFLKDYDSKVGTPAMACGDYYGYQAMKQHAYIAKNFDKLTEAMGPDCSSAFLQNYIYTSANLVAYEKQFEDFCKNHKTKNCEGYPALKKMILSTIDRFVGKVHSERGNKAVENVLSCSLDVASGPLLDILQKLKKTAEIINCSELKPGERKRVSSGKGMNEVKTGNFLLERTADNKYRASLDISFKVGTAEHTTAEKMKARVKGCIDTIAPYLKGPDGNVLEIGFLNKDQVAALPYSDRPLPQVIGIEAPGFRSHSLDYEEDVSCPTISHEILHLFGLCDEYEETENPTEQNYKCRIVPKVTSIMKDHEQAFTEAVPTTYTCKCTDATCKSVMASPNKILKDLYLNQNMYDKSIYEFRSRYCKLRSDLPPGIVASMDKPGVPFILVKDDGNIFSFENRSPTANVSKYTREAMNCTCVDGDKDCLDQKAAIIERIKIPVMKSSCDDPEAQTNLKLGSADKQGEIKFAAGRYTVTTKPNLPSLIHPGHFARIIGGACPSKGAIYNECASFAYQYKDCKVPEYCHDDSKFLGTQE